VVSPVMRGGIGATKVDVVVAETAVVRTYAHITGLIDEARLPERVANRAQATFAALADAEGLLHRRPAAQVHFHEVGGVDAIIDVVGSAAALEHLGARLVVSPLPMGHGKVKARHGILPLPAPATVECLRGIPTYDAGIAFELVTPTGAAIVGAHAESSSRWPSMAPERTGWGAGSFRHAFPTYQKNYPEIYVVPWNPNAHYRWEYAHNDYVQLVAELGLIGAGLLLAMLACGARHLIRHRIWQRPHLMFIVLALLITTAHAWVDFQFHNPAILVLWCASAALVGRWAEFEARSSPRSSNS